MGVNIARGDSEPIAQVQTFQVTADSASTTYNVIMNGKTIGTVGTGTGTSATAAAIVAALNALTVPAEFGEVVWTNPSSNNITATAATPGVPFTFTLSVVGGSGTFSAITTVTVSSGPLHADDPTNWSAGWIPQGACTVPVQANVVAVSGGSLTNATPYYWVVTAINNNGETTKSNEKTYTPSGGNDTGQISWAAVPNATGYKVYRSTTSGTYGATSLVTTLGNVLSYNDTGTALVAGQPPVSNGAVADTVYFTNSSNNFKYGLQALATVSPINLYFDASYTGTIGLTDYNPLGYREYRPKYLQFAGCQGGVYIGEGGGVGSGMLKLDFQSTAVIITVLGMGNSVQTGLPALTINGSNAGNSITIMQGTVGLAIDPSATANFPTINTGYVRAVTSDVTLTIGSGHSTGATINQNGGAITSMVSIGTLNKTAGNFTIIGAATIGTVTNDGGAYYWNGTGTMTSGTFRGTSSTLDCSQVPGSRTASSLTVTGGATLNDPDKVIGSLAYATDSVSLTKANLGNAPFTLTRS